MQTLKMDFQSQSTPPVVPVMQSDAQSRFIGITLYNGGAPYEAPEGASYTVQYRGPGANNMGWYDTIQLSSGTRKAVIVDSTSKNVVTLELAEQALRVNGNVFVNLCVVTNTGYMLKTFPILCRVTGAAFPDTVAVQSFFYVTGITSEQWLAYVTACQDAQKRAEAAAAAFQTDPTLSVKGKAADAKETGNKISQLKEDLNSRRDFLFSNKSFTQGWFNVAGTLQTTDDTDIFNTWSMHKKIISAGNMKLLLIINRSSKKLSFQPYLYSDVDSPSSLGTAFEVDAYDDYRYKIPSDCAFLYMSCSGGIIQNYAFDVYGIYYDYVANNQLSYTNITMEHSFGGQSATVAVNGGGDYTSIGEAYNATGRNGCLYVKSGRYISSAPLSLDEAYLFGENRETTIIKNTNAVYPNDALRVRSGVVEGLSIVSTMDNSEERGSYASHIDEDSYADKSLIFRNCNFFSAYQSSVGIGMRANQVLMFENCRFLSGSMAGLFLHDWLQASFKNNEYVIFNNCVFEGDGDYALKLQSVNDLNTLIVTFINCTLKSKSYGNENCIEFVTKASRGYLCGNSIKLGAFSHGNNVDMLNAY